MWIFSKHGFFSCTQSTYKPGQFNVRARSRLHLEALQKAHGRLIASCKIIETKAADYRWRIMMKPATWHKLAAAMAEEVDYSNFKNACHHGQADDISSQLLQVWSIMNRFQGHSDGDGFPGLPLFWEDSRSDAGPLIPDDIDLDPEPEPERFDFSEIEHDLQNASGRGILVRPSLEGLPDDWQEQLQAWMVDPLAIEPMGDDAFTISFDTAADAGDTLVSEALGEDPVEVQTTAPTGKDDADAGRQEVEENADDYLPQPGSRAAALQTEQAKIDALLADESLKAGGGPLVDRGPGEKPHRPDAHDQRAPDLGVVLKPSGRAPVACPSCGGKSIEARGEKYGCQACDADLDPVSG